MNKLKLLRLYRTIGQAKYRAHRALCLGVSLGISLAVLAVFSSGCSTSDPPDADGDGVADSADNCPLVANGLGEADSVGMGNQSDTDNDSKGDACDNCPMTANADQLNTDEADDGGDVCDDDDDNDGVDDNTDNCPLVANGQSEMNTVGLGDQTNTDGENDGGDACDDDDDDDGVLDAATQDADADNCPLIANPDQTNDDDSDGSGNICDVDDDGDGLIEINTPAEMDNIQYNLAGTTYDDEEDDGAGNLGSSTGCGGLPDVDSCSGYELTAAMTLSNSWTALGTYTEPFTGTLDGNDNIITIVQNDLGGFIDTLSGTLMNIHLRKSSDTAGSVKAANTIALAAAGAAVNVFEGSGLIVNVSSDLPVKGGNGVSVIGGLVGYNNGGTIQNSYASGNVSDDAEDTGNVGGLVGINNGTIQNSYASGSVSSEENIDAVGGLVGFNSGTISNSYASGSVNSGLDDDFIGGLAGVNYNVSDDALIENSFALGTVNGGAGTNQAGRLVGSVASELQGGIIQNSHAVAGAGNLVGQITAGVGADSRTAVITNSSEQSEANLQAPMQPSTVDSEIYFVGTETTPGWSVKNWNFGTASEYPVLRAYRLNSDGTQTAGAPILCGQRDAPSDCP